MLQRLRARAVDGATMLVRLLDARRERAGLRETVEHLIDERDDARRERDEYARLVATREVEIDELLRLRAEVERLTAERDEHAQGVSVLACRIDRVQQERDARIPADIDGAQAWLAARGWWFEREDSSPLSEPWSAYRDTAAEPVLVADTYWWAVLQALGEDLSEAWNSAPSPEDDA